MSVIVRMAPPEFDQLRALLFRRYPNHEWATFARFGWRESPDGLVLTLATVTPPEQGDLDERVGHVAIQESYTLRIALSAESQPLAVAVIHSHPRDYIPRASDIDDDMDAYYADYFSGFAPNRPYVSLIFSELAGDLAISGRTHWKNRWMAVDHFAVEGVRTQTWVGGQPPRADGVRERTRRFADSFGAKAAADLRGSTVAVIGAGGTGSAAIEVLARAGVGRLIIVDPDHLDESNLERVHGSSPAHAEQRIAKVALAKEHVQKIDPTCEVLAIFGALPQPEVVDAVLKADAAIGCTDQQHSRLALSDLAVRFLVPSIDCGVTLEGSQGKITGQIVQLVRFLAADSCALCRRMVNPQRLQQELMSELDRTQRRNAAAEASARGEDANRYWHDVPQLNTVGYLTTAAGALAAGYIIGWITKCFVPPFERLQMNLVAQWLDVTDSPVSPLPHCSCRRFRGWADQAAADAFITAPAHWPRAQIL